MTIHNFEVPDQLPDCILNTLTACVDTVVKCGYQQPFTIDEQGLCSAAKDKHYRPDQISVVNFYSFVGQSANGNNATLYAIETNDGSKGILIDTYKRNADDLATRFFAQVVLPSPRKPVETKRAT